MKTHAWSHRGQTRVIVSGLPCPGKHSGSITLHVQRVDRGWSLFVAQGPVHADAIAPLPGVYASEGDAIDAVPIAVDAYVVGCWRDGRAAVRGTVDALTWDAEREVLLSRGLAFWGGSAP